MALGTVNVTTENKAQGTIDSVEHSFVFIGVGTKNRGNILYINGDSDLDDSLGVADSPLKTNITKAKLNAGQNWSCVVLPLNSGDSWSDAVDQAMNENITAEAIVLTDPVTAKSDYTDMHAKAVSIEASLGRRLFFIAGPRVFDAGTDTWDAYITEVNALTNGVSAYRVSPVAQVFAGFLGTYAGRLSNTGVSIADSPMRVKTGTLIDIAELPQDSAGTRFNNAHAKALNDARYTVPQTYADYPGIYCSDGMTLDALGGDFQVIENLRVIDKAARQVRVLALARIADRQINNTPIAMAAAVKYFTRPLINMSVAAIVNDVMYPSEIQPPKSGDVAIVWTSNTSIDIYLAATPYNNPKSIHAKVSLDLSV